jgi:hypothetical protein
VESLFINYKSYISSQASPPLFGVMNYYGKEKTLAVLQSAIEKINTGVEKLVAEE